MSDRTVSVAEAKARLSELVTAVQAGDDVVITKRGKPVALLVGMRSPRRPISLQWLRSRTSTMPVSATDSADVVRRLRDAERY
jgi:prevent-host-death family protein